MPSRGWQPGSTSIVPRLGQRSSRVDPSGGSCVRRSNPAPWVDARACRSLWAAYKTARSGDIINITDGTYTSQTLGGGTKRILFRAAGPGRPRFGQIVSAASDVTLRGVAIEARDIDANPSACSGPDNAILYPCGARQTFANVVIDGLNGRSTHVHGIRGVGVGSCSRTPRSGTSSTTRGSRVVPSAWSSTTTTGTTSGPRTSWFTTSARTLTAAIVRCGEGIGLSAAPRWRCSSPTGVVGPPIATSS